MSEHSGGSSAEGSVAGAGVGTGYLGLISYIPESHHWLKDMLTLFAPAITVLIAIGWMVIRTNSARWYLDKQLSRAIQSAERHCADICSDPNSDEDDKANAVSAVKNLKKLRFEAIADGFERVKAEMNKLENK